MKRLILLLSLLSLAPAAGAQTTTSWAQIPDSENPYVRTPRKMAVSAELGFNSLASVIGVKGTYFVTPQFLMDAGLGLSSSGLRPGIYGRYLFSKAKLTTFVYGGLKCGLGTLGGTETVTDSTTHTDYQLETFVSPYMDYGVGLDYLAHGGFNFSTGLGWSSLLRKHNYQWVGATPPDDVADQATFGLGSGLAFWLSFGGAF